jgi:hypothetical protein
MWNPSFGRFILSGLMNHRSNGRELVTIDVCTRYFASWLKTKTKWSIVMLVAGTW